MCRSYSLSIDNEDFWPNLVWKKIHNTSNLPLKLKKKDSDNNFCKGNLCKGKETFLEKAQKTSNIVFLILGLENFLMFKKLF